MKKYNSKFYTSLTEAILNTNLKDFMRENDISIGLLSLMLQCSEAYIKEMINNKDIPSLDWLGKASTGMFFAVARHRKKEPKEEPKEKPTSSDLIDAINSGTLGLYRKQLNLSQSCLGQLLGISKKQVGRIEKTPYISHSKVIKRIQEKCPLLDTP